MSATKLIQKLEGGSFQMVYNMYYAPKVDQNANFGCSAHGLTEIFMNFLIYHLSTSVSTPTTIFSIHVLFVLNNHIHLENTFHLIAD